MRFRLSLVCLSLVLSSLEMLGQQPAPGSLGNIEGCLQSPPIARQIRSAPGLKLDQVCKAVLPGAEQGRKGFKPLKDAAKYIGFDVPDAVNGFYIAGIDGAGDVAGTYYDQNQVCHGFLRNAGGTMISFDDPNAVYCTSASGINEIGAITGYYWDVNQQYVGSHGYVRGPDGRYVTFDVPNAVVGTFPGNINLEGAISGSWWDANYVCHGFVRDPSGTITSFDFPDQQAFYPCGAGSINIEGTVAGGLSEAGVFHGFLRTWNGALTTFDVPGGTQTAEGAVSINWEGAVASTYFQPIQGNPFGGNWRGFLRKWTGTYETFDAATYPPCCIWTFVQAIAPDGTITGYENDGYNVNHGFIRQPNGNIMLFDPPGAGTGEFQGTIPVAINLWDVITGTYVDSSGATHGFLRIPQ